MAPLQGWNSQDDVRPADSTPRLRVLVVDCDASLRRALARTLRLANFEAEVFASVDELVARGVTDRDLCLVLDVDALGIDGLVLVRSMRVWGRGLPMIFTTALGPYDAVAEEAGLAPLAILCKPFVKEELLEAVRGARHWSRR